MKSIIFITVSLLLVSCSTFFKERSRGPASKSTLVTEKFYTVDDFSTTVGFYMNVQCDGSYETFDSHDYVAWDRDKDLNLKQSLVTYLKEGVNGAKPSVLFLVHHASPYAVSYEHGRIILVNKQDTNERLFFANIPERIDPKWEVAEQCKRLKEKGYQREKLAASVFVKGEMSPDFKLEAYDYGAKCVKQSKFFAKGKVDEKYTIKIDGNTVLFHEQESSWFCGCEGEFNPIPFCK